LQLSSAYPLKADKDRTRAETGELSHPQAQRSMVFTNCRREPHLLITLTRNSKRIRPSEERFYGLRIETFPVTGLI
jgi:hypothetical protein